MTTDTELRDLLAAEAGGATSGGGDWDDIVGRGRRRQRARRVQRVALVALVGGLAATAVALASDDPTVETTPPATNPTTTNVDGGATPTSSTALPYGFRITGVRSHGAFLTLTMLWEFRALDLCTELHPWVVESSEQVAIELSGEGEGQRPRWADCRSGDREAWATLELEDPLGARTVTNGTGGSEFPVVDGRSLLFPGELPAPFVMEQREEGSGQFSVLDEDGYRTQARDWSFGWTAGRSGLDLSIVASTDSGKRLDLSQWVDAECDGEREDVALRGTTARLCRGTLDGEVSYSLAWEEDGKAIGLDYTSTDEASLTLDGVLAIAEGLEALEG